MLRIGEAACHLHSNPTQIGFTKQMNKVTKKYSCFTDNYLDKRRPIEWAKEYAKKLTLAEKESKKGVLLKLSSSMLIDKNVRNSCNAGYLFLQDIYYSLGLEKY